MTPTNTMQKGWKDCTSRVVWLLHKCMAKKAPMMYTTCNWGNYMCNHWAIQNFVTRGPVHWVQAQLALSTPQAPCTITTIATYKPPSVWLFKVCLEGQLGHDHANRTFIAYFISLNQWPCSRPVSEWVSGGQWENFDSLDIRNYQ